MQGDPGLETPPDEVYTVLSDQTVQEFLDKQTKGMDGPSGAFCATPSANSLAQRGDAACARAGAFDGHFDICRSPPAAVHAHLSWDKCRRIARRKPVRRNKSWDENRVEDGQSLTIFWNWDF